MFVEAVVREGDVSMRYSEYALQVIPSHRLRCGPAPKTPAAGQAGREPVRTLQRRVRASVEA